MNEHGHPPPPPGPYGPAGPQGAPHHRAPGPPPPGAPHPGHPPQGAPAGSGCLKALAIGCTTLLLLFVAGGVAAAYALGWLSGSGDHTEDPRACELLDEERSAEISGAKEPPTEWAVRGSSDRRIAECAHYPYPYAGQYGHEVQLNATLFRDAIDFLVRENGEELAAAYLSRSYLEPLSMEKRVCADGREVYVGDSEPGDPGSLVVGVGMDSNLVVEVEIHPYDTREEDDSDGLDPGAKAEAAFELVCTAMARL